MRPVLLLLFALLLAVPAVAQDLGEQEEGGSGDPWVEGWVRLQLQYDDGSLGTRSRTNKRPSVDGITRFPAEDEYSVRRLQAQLITHLNEDWELQLQGVYQERQDQINLQRLALRYQLLEDTSLTAGFQKVPFDYEQIRTNSQLNVIERTDVTRALAQNRDTGLALHGEPGWGEWAIGTYLGQDNFDLTDPLSTKGGQNVIGRVVLHLSDEVDFGGYGHLGTFHDQASGVVDPVRRFGTELRYREGPWKVETEYLWSYGYNFFSEANTPAQGFYLDTVYTAADWLDLVAHYDQFDPDLSHANLRVPDNSVNARSRIVLGTNVYLDRETRERIAVNYEIHTEQEGPSVANDGFRIQYQVQVDF